MNINLDDYPNLLDELTSPKSEWQGFPYFRNRICRFSLMKSLPFSL